VAEDRVANHCSALPLLAFAACRDDGPAAKAGASIDKAAQGLKDAIDPPGPVEKMGRAIDKALQ